MMNRTWALAAVIGLGTIGLLIGGCAKNSGNTELADGRVQRTGFLQSDAVAVGGETTGWVLVTARDGGSRTEVDVSRVRETAERLKTRRVVITGTMEDRAYTTRGKVPTLIAESIIWDEAQTNERNAGNLPPPPSPSRR